MRTVLGKVFSITKKYIKYQIIGFIFTILYTIAVFLSPILSQYLIDVVIPTNSLAKLKVGILIFFLGCVAQPIFAYLKNIVFMWISENTTIYFRREMFKRVINASMDFFDESNSGAIVSRISNDGRSVSEFITNFYTVFIKNIVLVIMIIIGMFSISIPITAIILSVFGLYFLTNAKIAYKFNGMSKKIQESYDRICIKIDHSIESINTIKMFNKQECEIAEFQNIIQDNYHNNVAMRKLNLTINSVSNGVMIACLSLVYGLGSLMVLEGKLTLGAVVALGLYFQMLAQPIYELINNNIDIQSILPIIERIEEYMNIPTEDKEEMNLELSNLKMLQIKDVSFKYKNGVSALKKVNLQLPDKGVFAIVGDSGAGKSSIIKLLSGYYSTYEGEILLNEEELRKYSIKSIRENISIVCQDTELINDTIKNNIAYGNDLSDKQIEDLLKRVNLHHTIAKLDNGYETIVNERVNLSGGEKQRLCIARALAKEAMIYILDEPTAALDTINEGKIKEIIEELGKEKLVILITHNLNLLNKTDGIFVMKQGEVIEQGNYETLTNKNTYFNQLINELCMKEVN